MKEPVNLRAVMKQNQAYLASEVDMNLTSLLTPETLILWEDSSVSETTEMGLEPSQQGCSAVSSGFNQNTLPPRTWTFLPFTLVLERHYLGR